jgi:hypothetical protein
MRRVGPKFHHQSLSKVLGRKRQTLGPVHASPAKFRSAKIDPKRWLWYTVKIFLEPREDVAITKPLGRLGVHFGRRGSKDQDMAPVLQRGHIPVECPPIIADDDHTASRDELAWDTGFLQVSRG